MKQKIVELDILIIGGGPIGLACGIEADKAGLSYIIIEKGCLVNSLYHYPTNMTFFSSSERLEIGDTPFVTTNTKPRRSEALEYYRRIQQKFELRIKLFEEVTDVIPELNGSSYRVQTSKGEYIATNVIVATGFYDHPILLNIPGEDLSKVRHYYNDPHYYAGQNVIVVGASNSSIDAALETYRKGAKVTLVVRGSEISPRVKYWVKPDIENRILSKEIDVLYNSCLRRVNNDSVEISTPDGVQTIQNDFVLALTGYKPNFDFLSRIGISIPNESPRTPLHDLETMETNMNGIYLAGVVCGGLNTHLWFIENSRVHATQIVAHILSKKLTS